LTRKKSSLSLRADKTITVAPKIGGESSSWWSIATNWLFRKEHEVSDEAISFVKSLVPSGHMLKDISRDNFHHPIV